MSIKSTDGKIEMTLSSFGEKTFLGGLKAINDIVGEVKTSEISIPKAELDTVFGEDVKVLNFKNGETIEVSDITKGD